MKLTYTNVNGYLIPNLAYKSGEQMEQLGKYGFLRRDYLKNHRNSTYQVMLLQDTIGEHLLEVDKAAREREEVILKQLEEKEPLPVPQDPVSSFHPARYILFLKKMHRKKQAHHTPQPISLYLQSKESLRSLLHPDTKILSPGSIHSHLATTDHTALPQPLSDSK